MSAIVAITQAGAFLMTWCAAIWLLVAHVKSPEPTGVAGPQGAIVVGVLIFAGLMTVWMMILL
jgi:hypothetical protein